MIKKQWVLIALFYLVLAATFGLLLRLQLFSSLFSLNYKFILHTHSHVALLGWVFTALFVAIVYAFLPAYIQKYKVLFWITQISVVGMLFSFPFQGYAAISIIFSTLFLFVSYWFTYGFFSHTNKLRVSKKTLPLSFSIIRASLLYLAFSSIGPWALGPMMVLEMKGTDLYNFAIYFYLHFLYNGFFTLAILGIFFRILEQKNIAFQQATAQRVFNYINWSIIPTFLLSTLGISPPNIIYILASFGALLQVLALYYFIVILKEIPIQTFSKWALFLFKIALLAFSLKIIMQLFSAIPWLVIHIHETKNSVVIGYLHMVLLGFVSVFLLAYFISNRSLLITKKISRIGILTFLIGLIGSEFILFGQGGLQWIGITALPHYYEWLFTVSMLMPMGLLPFFFSQLGLRK